MDLVTNRNVTKKKDAVQSPIINVAKNGRFVQEFLALLDAIPRQTQKVNKQKI